MAAVGWKAAAIIGENKQQRSGRINVHHMLTAIDRSARDEPRSDSGEHLSFTALKSCITH